jgi:hypothetical protein
MANQNIYDNWSASGASSFPNDQFDIKIDHRFSEKNLISGKYSHQWSSNHVFNCFGNFADPCAGGPNENTENLFTLNDTQTLSPTLLLTATLGFTRSQMRITAYNGAGGVTDPLSKLVPRSTSALIITPPALPAWAATPTAITSRDRTRDS